MVLYTRARVHKGYSTQGLQYTRATVYKGYSIQGLIVSSLQSPGVRRGTGRSKKGPQGNSNMREHFDNLKWKVLDTVPD